MSALADLGGVVFDERDAVIVTSDSDDYNPRMSDPKPACLMDLLKIKQGLVGGVKITDVNALFSWIGVKIASVEVPESQIWKHYQAAETLVLWQIYKQYFELDLPLLQCGVLEEESEGEQ